MGAIWLFITEHATVLSAVVSAVSTVAIAVFTISLVKASNQQGVQTERALIANRRPFVFVEDFRQLYDLAPDVDQPPNITEPRKVTGWHFRPMYVNSGESPTKGLVTHVDYEFRDRLLPDNFPFIDNHNFNAKMLIGPNSRSVGGNPRTFSVAELAQIAEGKMFLYLWGWVRYDGLIEAPQQYLTRYCFQVLVGSDPSRVGTAFTFVFPNVGNCSDNECEAIGLP